MSSVNIKLGGNLFSKERKIADLEKLCKELSEKVESL